MGKSKWTLEGMRKLASEIPGALEHGKQKIGNAVPDL